MAPIWYFAIAAAVTVALSAGSLSVFANMIEKIWNSDDPFVALSTGFKQHVAMVGLTSLSVLITLGCLIWFIVDQVQRTP